MPQNDRNSRNRKRRRAYDQARDDRRGGQSTQRRSSAGAGSDLGYSGYAGYSSGGHPITNPNYDPDAPRPSRYTERTVNYGSYPDNSITFPTGGGGSPSGAQRPPRGGGADPRPYRSVTRFLHDFPCTALQNTRHIDCNHSRASERSFAGARVNYCPLTASPARPSRA